MILAAFRKRLYHRPLTNARPTRNNPNVDLLR
jgi:hypothetical protein